MGPLQRLPVLRGFDPCVFCVRQERTKNALCGLLMQAEISKRVVTPGFEDEVELGNWSGFRQSVVFKNRP